MKQSVTEETAGVLVQSPNFFGIIEDIPAIAEIAHKKGALLIVSIAEAVSLGVVRPPVEADIVSMEAQSFGVALSYGGPFCGVIAAKEQFLRQMPGRLVGQTTDRDGNRGFVLTLSTREQHIRREKATSNICTNQALVALMATIFLTVYGKEGIRELAEQNLAKAHYAATELSAQAGNKLLFSGAPRFHEFVLETGESPGSLAEAPARQQNRRRHRPGPLVSRTRQRDAMVRNRNDHEAADRQGRQRTGCGTGGGLVNMMDPAELEAIRKRCDAATAGPWESFVEGRDHLSGNNFIRTGGLDNQSPDIELLGASIADQDFIAHARQDIPRLLNEIERLKKKADDAL